MRILGLGIMVVGIISGLLLLLARLGGGQVSATAFIVVALMVGGGWRLRAYGKGLTPRQPSAPGSQRGFQSTPAQQAASVELPYTKAMSDVLSRKMKHSRRVTAILIASGMSFFLLVGAVLDFATQPASGFRALPFLAAAGLVFGLIVGVIWLLTGDRPIRRDLRESTYRRTSGPVQLVAVYGGWMLRLADRAFLVDARPAKTLRNVSWAVVDHSRHAHLIFEVKDHSGQRIYSGLE